VQVLGVRDQFRKLRVRRTLSSPQAEIISEATSPGVQWGPCGNDRFNVGIAAGRFRGQGKLPHGFSTLSKAGDALGLKPFGEQVVVVFRTRCLQQGQADAEVPERFCY
jgi:hypothetical protein